MQYFIDLVASGLVVGALYALMAMGFAVTYKATGVVNFALGEMTMLVAYIAWTLAATLGPRLWLVALGSVAASVVIGLVLERVVMRAMIGEPVFSNVMVTVGIGIIIRSVILMVWGPSPHALDVAAGRNIVKLGMVTLRSSQLAVLVVFLVLLAALWAYFRFSRFGIAMRAVAADDRSALLMGVNTGRVYAVAWAASSTIAGIAGVFFAAIYDVAPTIFELGLRSFPSTILGGLDAVLGSGLSGLIVGITENLSGGYLNAALKEVSGFMLIVVVLMIRPFGLFGEREIERV